MCHHSQLCKPAPAGIEEDNDENQEGESDIDDSSKDNDDFTFS